MRLTPEEIKQAIVSPDQKLREAAIYYFARSSSRDPSLMPLAIQAFEQFGLNAFELFVFLEDLVQTDATAAWLIREIERVDPDEDETSGDFVDACVDALWQADIGVLRPHVAAIEAIQELDDGWKLAIVDRIEAATLGPDDLWNALIDACEQLDEQDEPADPFDLGAEYCHSLVDALASFPDQCAARALGILEQGGDTGGWLEVMAARLAGRLRLEEAVPYLVDLFSDIDLLAYSDAHQALARIGTDSVVTELAGRYEDADDDFRMSTAYLLRSIPSDLSAQTCLELFDREQDLATRAVLIQSVLANFVAEGIEPARQFVLATPKCPEALDVRDGLLVAAKMMGATFPEFEAWTEDAKTDREFRIEWSKDHPLAQFGDEFGDGGDEEPWEYDEDLRDDFEDEDGLDDEDMSPPDTVIKRSAKVGRNDPCPCGSGKKFKKCCVGKSAFAEADSDHPASAPAPSAANRLEYPIGTIAFYGPHDKITTKIVAGVFKRDGDDAIIERWVGANIKESPKVKRQIKAFFDRHKVKNVAIQGENMGCPHEEGIDFRLGQDCPFCPYWAGKQGTNRRTDLT